MKIYWFSWNVSLSCNRKQKNLVNTINVELFFCVPTIAILNILIGAPLLRRSQNNCNHNCIRFVEYLVRCFFSRLWLCTVWINAFDWFFYLWNCTPCGSIGTVNDDFFSLKIGIVSIYFVLCGCFFFLNNFWKAKQSKEKRTNK